MDQRRLGYEIRAAKRQDGRTLSAEEGQEGALLERLQPNHRKKRADMQRGKQFSAQPKDVADKAARYRETGHHTAAAPSKTRFSLYAEARQRGIPGRSTMTKAQLFDALQAR